MKSLIFKNLNNTVNVEFITDLMTEGQNQFSVMSIRGLEDSERALGFNFQQLPYDVQAFKAFALQKGLELSVSDSNGEVGSIKSLLVNLTVTAPVAASSTADTTPAFTGTATPLSVIDIKIGATTVSTTANASGVWSTSFSVLAPGAISAVITASKDGLTKSVTRAFTITA